MYPSQRPACLLLFAQRPRRNKQERMVVHVLARSSVVRDASTQKRSAGRHGQEVAVSGEQRGATSSKERLFCLTMYPLKPISEPSLDFLEPMARPMPVPPPFGRSYSTPDHRLYTTSSTSSSTSSLQQHSGRSARASASASGRGAAGYGNRPASASVSASAPTAASTRRSLGELRLSVSPTIPTYASTPTLLSPPLPSGPMAVVSPWQIFSPSYAFAHLPPSEQDAVSHAATMASAAAAEQRQQQQQQQQHMSPYPYLAASTNTQQMQAHGQARSPALSQGSTFLPPPPVSPQLARSPQLPSNPSMAEASVEDQDGETS